MTYVKINNTLYAASITGNLIDKDWGNRSSKTIKLTMSAATAIQLFVNDISWSIVEQIPVYNKNDEIEETIENEYDNSDYCIAGDITDHRDGTISVKMGKLTDREMINIMIGESV